MQGWIIFAVALFYIALLFAIAAFGDRKATRLNSARPRPVIYTLSLAVYCTSWTFYGSVGLASTNGLEYLGIFIGPILVFTLGMPLLRRMAKLTKTERITSIADFIASRYGKNGKVAAVAAMIAVVGTVPYIALQLKSISDSVTILAEHYSATGRQTPDFKLEVSVFVTVMLTAFAILFGTRHADATEHQDGLILAVAIESLIKLVVFLVVGIAIIGLMYGGISQIADAVQNDSRIADSIRQGSVGSTWLVLIVLSASAILVLPRQFHVIFVEYRSESELAWAGRLFPLYLVAINLLVFPIAISGVLNLGETVPSDMYLLALPLQNGNDILAFLAFAGGFSAATAMVIVASVALAVMVSNDLVIPLMIRNRGNRLDKATGDWADVILNVRRCAILAIMFFAFAYYTALQSNAALSSIGLLSFAAIAQLMPALIFGLLWRGANARGAVLGMIGGFTIWIYCLLLPTLLPTGHALLEQGLFGLAALKPQALFFVEANPLDVGVFWSLLANIILLFLGSRTRPATALERIQAISFIPRDPNASVELRRFTTSVTTGEVKKVLARYLGQERMERAFRSFEIREGRALNDQAPTDIGVARYAEQALASTIGASSARLVLSLLLEKGGTESHDAVRLLDSASEAIQQNRDIVQTALDQMDQGVAVFDDELKLMTWNRQFRRVLDLPAAIGQFGIPLKVIFDQLVDDGQIGRETHRQGLAAIASLAPAWRMDLSKSRRIIEIRANAMPDGGIVATFADVTAIANAEEALKRTKQSLELRVQARTAELTKVNKELAVARQTAEQANISKTRFLAAAGHDITQPLNAARIYASSLVERMDANERQDVDIAQKIDRALGSVETIIGAVLDISRLDAGALTPSKTVFALQELFDQMRNDFAPLAQERGIRLRFVDTSVRVETDRNLLRRLLQNLISNGIKYTQSGHVLVGVRHRGETIKLHVMDTGIGIPPQKAASVFKEFERLQDGAKISSGLGLGLSIVDRISRVLDLPITLKSEPGRGSNFCVDIPISHGSVEAMHTADRSDFLPRQALAGFCVACADNEQDILDGMRILLGGWGVNVIDGLDQATLIKKIEKSETPPNVVLADYHLDNEQTGLDLITAVRATLGHQVPAILITADRSAELQDQAIERDIVVINKPLKPAQLRALLSNIGQQRHAAE